MRWNIVLDTHNIAPSLRLADWLEDVDIDIMLNKDALLASSCFLMWSAKKDHSKTKGVCCMGAPTKINNFVPCFLHSKAASFLHSKYGDYKLAGSGYIDGLPTVMF